jgi:hypothetical protein
MTAPGIGVRAGLLALMLAWQAPAACADELADFHAAVAIASAEYRAMLQTLDTRGREETAAAVGRFRQTWQAVADRFAERPPTGLADADALPATFMQIDSRLVGAMIVIDIGSRDAARAALEPIAEILAKLSARSAPAPH